MGTDDSRSISATERKTLEKLLDDEFSLLRNDLRRVADEVIEMRIEAIRVDQATIVKRGRDAEDEIRAKVRDLIDDGYTIVGRSGYEFEIRIKSDVIEKAIERAKKEIGGDLETALRLAGGRQHQAKKDLMKATLSERAVALLDELPKAAELLDEARRETVALGTGTFDDNNEEN